jgi:regulatory protein
MEDDPFKKIMSKAGQLLARRAHSRGQLREKLAPHGEIQQIESVLDRLEQLNLLNDAEYAYNSASRWMKQDGFGPAKVYHLLRRRQVSAAVADAAMERAGREIDEIESLRNYLARRSRTQSMPANRKSVDKLFQSLQRRGFSREAIWEVLRQTVPPGAWREFETGE